MPVEQSLLFLRFGVALGIGFLIGLQREVAHSSGKRNIVAGERTFSLVSLGGALAAMLADHFTQDATYALRVKVRSHYTWQRVYRERIAPLLLSS